MGTLSWKGERRGRLAVVRFFRYGGYGGLKDREGQVGDLVSGWVCLGRGLVGWRDRDLEVLFRRPEAESCC